MRTNHDDRPDWIRRHERLAERYGGFYYPWRSEVEAENGEDVYTELVRKHLRPDIDVVEPGCGHGTDALTFGPLVRSYCAYDAVEPYVAIARRRASERGLKTVKFVVADSGPKRGGRIPVDDGRVDLIISRRGPSNFILDARRACRPGGTLLQVCYLPPPPPDWNGALPAHLRVRNEPDTACEKVQAYFERADLQLHSSAIYDVHEYFDDPSELLVRLAWDRRMDLDEAADLAAVSEVFRSAAVGGRLHLRHRRLLWKAIVSER
jgi:SAM-dependent methyltransferase